MLHPLGLHRHARQRVPIRSWLHLNQRTMTIIWYGSKRHKPGSFFLSERGLYSAVGAGVPLRFVQVGVHQFRKSGVSTRRRREAPSKVFSAIVEREGSGGRNRGGGRRGRGNEGFDRRRRHRRRRSRQLRRRRRNRRLLLLLLLIESRLTAGGEEGVGRLESVVVGLRLERILTGLGRQRERVQLFRQ